MMMNSQTWCTVLNANEHFNIVHADKHFNMVHYSFFRWNDPHSGHTFVTPKLTATPRTISLSSAGTTSAPARSIILYIEHLQWGAHW